MFLEAAVFQAWFRDNPSKALFWVYRIRNEKLTRLQKLRLDIALLWAEGRLFDAWEKLGTGYLAELRELPASPGRTLAEESAAEWKRQMESRMLTRAWRSMYSISRQLEPICVTGSVCNAPEKAENCFVVIFSCVPFPETARRDV